MQSCQLPRVCLLIAPSQCGRSQRALKSCLCVAGSRIQRPEAARGRGQGRGSDFRLSSGGRDPRRDSGRRGGGGLGRGGRGRSGGGFPERRQSGSFSEEAYGDTDDWGAGSSTWGAPLQVSWLHILLSAEVVQYLLSSGHEQIMILPGSHLHPECWLRLRGTALLRL